MVNHIFGYWKALLVLTAATVTIGNKTAKLLDASEIFSSVAIDQSNDMFQTVRNNEIVLGRELAHDS